MQLLKLTVPTLITAVIHHIKPGTAETESELVREIYRQIRREFGVLGEPLTLHAPSPHLLAGVWSSFRESILAGAAPRAWKEVVAVGVSKLNQCPYCVDSHTVMLRAAASHEAASAIQYGTEQTIRDPQIRALADWAKATRAPGSGILANPPFPRELAPELIGTAVWIHYINRMVQIFLGRNLLFFSSNRLGLRSFSERLGGLFFSRRVARRLKAGASLKFLPEEILPPDLAWAAPSATVSYAFAGFAAAAEACGEASLPRQVREWLLEILAVWDGTEPELGSGWPGPALEQLSPENRPAGRLTLLSAIAPERITPGAIAEFRKRRGDEGTLLGGTAWSSFAAARRIGTWLI